MIGNGDFGSPLTGGEETRLGDTLGAPVWEGTGELAQELNRDVTTTLPMGDVVAGLEPGLYALTARVAGGPAREDWEASATQWFVVTDLGLAALTGADGLHVFLRGLSDAAAREGVEVTLLARNNDVLGRAVTDADGHARFDPGLLRGRGGAEAALVTAEAGQDFAFLSLAEPGFDLSDRGVAGRPAPPPVDVFVTTERGAYRPGETVFATVLARDDRARAIEGLTLTAIVTRADGVEYGRFPLPDQGAGGRALALPIDAGAPTGGWRLAVHADPEAPPLATHGVPGRGLHARAGRPRAHPARRAGRSGRAADPRGARGLPLGRAGGGTGARGRDYGWRWRASCPGGRASSSGSRTSRSSPATRRCRRRPPMPTARRAIPLALPAGRAGQPAAGADRDARVRDGSGRPVERSVTRPLLPAAPLIGVRPLFEGAVDEGGTAGFEAIALGRDLAPTDLAAVELDAVADRDRLPVVRGGRRLELRAGHPAQPGGERDGRPGRGRAGAARHARRLGPLRADAGGDRRPLHRDELGLRRRLGRGRGRLGDAGLPRAEPRPRSLCPRRHGAGADRRAERRAAPGRGDGRPADRDPHARRRGRRDGRRSAGNRGVGRRRLCDRDADPADGRRRRPQPGAGDRPRLGAGRSGAAPARRRLRGPGRGRAARRDGGGAEDRRARPRASAPMPPSPRSISAS